jgi:hypothetical protein
MLSGAPGDDSIRGKVLMMTSAEYLFQKIVQKAHETMRLSNTESVGLSQYELQIGTVLKFLGLAKRDDGWAANRRLMKILGEQLARQLCQQGEVRMTEHDRDFLGQLYYNATGFYNPWYWLPYDDPGGDYDESDAFYGCWNLLAALGLLTNDKGEGGRFRATRRLHRLYERGRDKELAMLRAFISRKRKP